jgi:alpha/beta superfamily hydrolase
VHLFKISKARHGGQYSVARGPSLRDAVNILGPAGQLEALLEQPKEPLVRKIAVLCHPHPQYQGTMLNKVVHTLARSMNDLGVPAIRFNFRGVGASEGEYAGGIGETEDTLSVIDWARDRYPQAELCLVGFSFGAMVACRAALSADPIQLVTVAPAVTRMQGLLEGSQPACPWLIVQGEADEVVACSEVIQWVNGLAPGPELIVLPDVGHFFHGCLTLLRETVVSHFSSQWINQ